MVNTNRDNLGSEPNKVNIIDRVCATHTKTADSVRALCGKTKKATGCAFVQVVPVGGDSITSIRAVIDALLAS
jgi:hypothetical protein